tara:strand:- start:291 stop:803 length:513 start_codon:yes stop_codon:yes gene_type:complete
MGGASTGGGGSGVPDMIRPAKVRRKENFKESLKNFKTPVMLVADAISKSVKKSKAKKQANVEVGLGTDSMSNYTIGQGGTRETGDNDGGNNNTLIPKVEVPKVDTSPTTVEVDQSSATDTTTVEEPKKEDDIYTRNKKTKARGRSMMTLTSAQGVKDNKLTLGKRSLLGS